MKVISETHRAHYIAYLRCYYDHRVNTSDGGTLFPGGIISPVFSVSTMTWFIRYIYH